MKSAFHLPVGSAKIPREIVAFPTEIVGLPMASAGNSFRPQITESPAPVLLRRLVTTPLMTALVTTPTLDAPLPTIISFEDSFGNFTAGGFKQKISIMVPIAITLFCVCLTA